MLSLFTRKPNPRKEPLYQITLSGGTERITAVVNEAPAGIILRVPVIMVMGEKVRTAMVRSFIPTQDLIQMAETANAVKTVTVTKEVVINDPAANRPKFCEHGHRQISENVIHWPNGTEDCRICYMSWPSTIAKKSREAERAAAKGGNK